MNKRILELIKKAVIDSYVNYMTNINKQGLQLASQFHPDMESWAREKFLESSIEMGIENIWNGSVTSPEQSHGSWFLHMQSEGWIFGESRDWKKKTHPCMLPWKDLSFEEQTKDYLFFSVVNSFKDKTND